MSEEKSTTSVAPGSRFTPAEVDNLQRLREAQWERERAFREQAIAATPNAAASSTVWNGWSSLTPPHVPGHAAADHPLRAITPRPTIEELKDRLARWIDTDVRMQAGSNSELAPIITAYAALEQALSLQKCACQLEEIARILREREGE